MEFKEAIKLALQSLWQNKLRTVLTLLGVMIGVASVIAVVTLVNGANTYVTTKFSRYGADVFTVSKMPPLITSSKQYEKFQKRKNVIYDDYVYVRDNCKRCIGIGAQQATVAKVTRGTNSVTDTADSRLHLADAQLAEPGHRRGPRLYRRRTKSTPRMSPSSAPTSATTCFPGSIRWGRSCAWTASPTPSSASAEKQGSTFGQSQDNWVGIPLTAYQKTYGTQKSVTIYVKAGAAGPVLEAGRRRGARADALAAATTRRASPTPSSWT